MPLIVISVLFGMSLLAAFVLFRVLKSTATVSKPEYQLGGAVAGFVVILSLLSVTYIQVDDKKQQENMNDLVRKLRDANDLASKASACLKEQASADVIYSGSVRPPLQRANVVLGVSLAEVQQDGRFAIKAHNVRPSDFPYLYVIGADSRAPYLQVFANDDPNKLTIPQ